MISTKANAGYIAMTITIILLLLVISLSLLTGRLLTNEQRIAANEMRYREALATTEAMISRSITTIAGSSIADLRAGTLPALESGVSASSTTVPLGTSTLPAFTLRANGHSTFEQQDSSAIVSVQVVVIPTVVSAPDSPLTLAAGISVGGNFNVVANPNGGGPGVPLSIWTAGTVDLNNGTGNTCGQQEWQDNTCSTSPYSYKGNVSSDIKANDANFPSDLLQYVFGVPDTATGMSALESKAKAKLNGCTSLSSASHGFYIVDGDCNAGNIGTRDAPVVLLLRNGNLTINGNNKIYGIVFAYDSYPNAAPSYDLKMTGGATVWGSLIANYQVGNANGTYNAVYDATTLSNIENGQDFVSIYKVPGSWRDW